jgi:hypothetical protein
VVNRSPIDELIASIDKLDPEATVELFASDGRLLTADGRRAAGTDAIRELMTAFLAQLRSTTHRVTAQWHPESVWIAEVEADYELQDFLQLKALPRAFVLRDGPNGIADVRVYGAHERLLSDHRTGAEGMRIGERWIPPL